MCVLLLLSLKVETARRFPVFSSIFIFHFEIIEISTHPAKQNHFNICSVLILQNKTTLIYVQFPNINTWLFLWMKPDYGFYWHKPMLYAYYIHLETNISCIGTPISSDILLGLHDRPSMKLATFSVFSNDVESLRCFSPAVTGQQWGSHRSLHRPTSSPQSNNASSCLESAHISTGRGTEQVSDRLITNDVNIWIE